MVYQLDFLKMNLLQSRSCFRTCSEFIIQAPSKWTYTNEMEYVGRV